MLVVKPIHREQKVVGKINITGATAERAESGRRIYTKAKVGNSVFQTFRVTDCRILRSTTVRNEIMSEKGTGSKSRREVMNLKNIQKIWLFALVLTTFAVVTAGGQTPRFNIVKPSTTGVPCDEVRLMGFDPAGNLWIEGRAVYWQEAAVAMLSADQLEHHPLPGGGFDTGAWKVWSSVHGAPIPSLYTRGLAFSSDGTMWFGSEGGLTRFRPNAQNPADQWFTYTPANSPLV